MYPFTSKCTVIFHQNPFYSPSLILYHNMIQKIQTRGYKKIPELLSNPLSGALNRAPEEEEELQIRGEGQLRTIQRYFFLNENICCDPSLEPSHQDGKMRGNKICFYGEIWLIIPKLSLLPPLIWSNV